MKILLLVVALLYCLSVKAGTIDPKVADSKYIEYGKKHECVVKISGVDDSNLQFFGSSVIIDKNIIITAAHIAKYTKIAHIHHKDKEYSISYFVIPKQYCENKIGGGGYDIALGFLEKEIILDFYPELYEKQDELNKICSLSGFGITGNFDTGSIIKDGKKRAGSNIIESIEDSMLVCSPSNNPNTSLEFLISNGDSGGGLFIDKKLAGVHSCVYTKHGRLNSGRNNFSMHTRISDHIVWIKKVIEEIKNEQSNISRITGDNGK